MQEYCKLPRPLSLSSDDLLHEAERMFATKFVSRFPSPENLVASHLVTSDLNSDALVSSRTLHVPTILSHSTVLSSSSAPTDATNRRRSVSDVYAQSDAPTIEDEEECSILPIVDLNDCRQTETFIIDPHGPLQVQNRVDIVLHKWGPTEPVNPELFFLKLLASRGYESELMPALSSKYNR